MKLLTLVLSALFIIPITADGQETVQQTLTHLPVLPHHQLTAGQFSSHSKHQHNGDNGEFLYRDENGDAVIFDVQGPGRITSMWGTVFDSSSILQFYFDGEKKPRYSINVIDFYNGRHDHFQSPLVTYDRRGYYIEGAYAGNSFVPVYFDHSLKISMKGKPTFYHILYEKRPYGSRWNDSIKTAQKNFLNTVFSNTGKPFAHSGQQRISLAGHQRADILKVQGAGSVKYLSIEADTSSAFLKDIFIQMIWDEETPGKENTPKLAFDANTNSRLYHVQAPIGMFFGSPHLVTEVHSLPVEINLLPTGRMQLVCRLPMPYWKNARITLVNRSGNRYNNIDAQVMTDKKPYAPSKTGYFTTYYRQGLTEYGRDWLFAEAQGTGWFLGVVQSCRLEHYCEGNEHFYIDGNRTPQINGTGTEDYYLGCLWPNMRYNTPFAGCVTDVRLLTGGDPKRYYETLREDYLAPAVYYRFHLDMPIPFYSSIDARIQHGAESQIVSEYASLAYLYLRNTPVLHQSDLIDVGTASSLQSHRYQSKGTNLNITGRYEGNYLYTAIPDAGKTHKNGEIVFTVAVPSKNHGVRLRRRTDQASGQQKATVYVDGKLAGTWIDPQRNDILRWYDSEFEIPASLTHNKSTLQIKLVVDSFNDFEYQVLTYD